MTTEKDDGKTGSSEGGAAGSGDGLPAGQVDRDAAPEGDIVAFFLEDLGRQGGDGFPAGAIERLRERTFAGGRLVRRIGFDRALPYLLKLRDYRRCVMRLCEVTEAALD